MSSLEAAPPEPFRRDVQGQPPARVAIIANLDDPIGDGVAMRLSRAGLGVAICGTDDGRISALQERIGAAGGRALAVGSIDGESSAVSVVERTLASFGRIDALVNGAYRSAADGWLSVSARQLEREAARILCAIRTATAAVAPQIARSGGGQIVNVVTCAGRYRSAWFRPDGDESSHAVAAGVEGAVLGFTREAAFELAPQKIRVNAVCMGLIRTPAGEEAWRRLSEHDRHTTLEEISLRRIGEPDEVAAVVEFLATGAGSYITGATIDVNGGWWMS